jgi:hypothetical protein
MNSSIQEFHTNFCIKDSIFQMHLLQCSNIRKFYNRMEKVLAKCYVCRPIFRQTGLGTCQCKAHADCEALFRLLKHHLQINQSLCFKRMKLQNAIKVKKNHYKWTNNWQCHTSINVTSCWRFSGRLCDFIAGGKFLQCCQTFYSYLNDRYGANPKFNALEVVQAHVLQNISVRNRLTCFTQPGIQTLLKRTQDCMNLQTKPCNSSHFYVW